MSSVGGESLTDKEKTIYMEAFGQYYNKEFARILKDFNYDSATKGTKEAYVEKLELARKLALKKGREAVEEFRSK